MRAIALWVCAIASVVHAQGPRGLMPKPRPGTTFDSTFRDTSKIVVKFIEGSPVRLRPVDGRPTWIGRADLMAANALIAEAKLVRRLFQRSEEELDAERAALLKRVDPAIDPPADLNNYYQVHAADEAAGLELILQLNELAVVEIAFPEHRSTFPCEPGDIAPVTPNYTGQQTYREPAPVGIDHRASRVIPGGRGEGLQWIDIESSWQLDHEDIADLVRRNVIGRHDQSLNPNHGVAVVGQIAADWDQFGVCGLVDQVDTKVHSHMREFWASSVDVAAANTPVGGFVVLEVQLSTNGRLTPMEVRQDVFDAVRHAVMAGKHVIAAAGNGSNDLDDPVFMDLFNPATRDSGSVIVGATEGSQLVRASFSNFGSRVNANGWGRDVVTAGYGTLFDPGDVRQYYTDSFNGTSSATPIVAGAAIALVGAVREQQGRELSPSELRNLLRQHGTRVPGGRIGRRPDLVKLLAAVGLPAGLDIPQDATIGESMRLRIDGEAGGSYAIAAARDRGLIDLGALGRFLLDPATTIFPFAGVLPSSGNQEFVIDLPVAPAIRQSALFLQAILYESGEWRLTNSVYNWVW